MSILYEQLVSDPLAFAEMQRVLLWDECEIEAPDFLGFSHVYEAVAMIVPEHWSVVDIGCNQAVQAHLFRRHAAYIGIDPHVPTEWRFDQANAVHVQADGTEWICRQNQLNVRSTFAVVSYVPDFRVAEAARRVFENLLVYYPAASPMPFLSMPPEPQ